jgi:hypothetical protein
MAPELFTWCAVVRESDYTPVNQTDFEERKQQCLGALKQTPPLEMVVGEASNLFEEFIVKGNRQVPITVAMINKDRKRFDDFSSLAFTWESSDEVPRPLFCSSLSSKSLMFSFLLCRRWQPSFPLRVWAPVSCTLRPTLEMSTFELAFSATMSWRSRRLRSRTISSH